jgi:saccharopine dehydrogenase-like NADP-dependent oxidoreductase
MVDILQFGAGNIATAICETYAASEGRVLCMFEGIRMLKPSAAVDTIIPGI